MLLRRVCLPRNFLKLSRYLRPDLGIKSVQQCRFESSQKPVVRESNFLSQFLPNYWPEPNEKYLNEEFCKIEDDYSKKSTEEVIKAFESLSYHCQTIQSYISEEKYNPLVNAVLEKLPDMTDEELIKILFDLTRFPRASPRSHNFSELWNKIDDECWIRSKNWRFPLLLKVMNAYFRLGINKISAFNTKAMLKMSAKLDKIPSKMLVEFMFYQSIIRHKEVPMYTIEARVNELFNEFTLDEIGIIGLAFFKREAKILNNSLLDRFYEKVS